MPWQPNTNRQLPNPHAKIFTPDILKQAMLQTIATINKLTDDENITEVRLNCQRFSMSCANTLSLQPSLMNFCVTDGESVVATRYISSRKEEAASLVRCSHLACAISITQIRQWYSSGTEFSEYAKGGHYKMSKADKRENIIMVKSSLHIHVRHVTKTTW